MATQIKLPEVAAGATHAVISSWLVNVGDTIVVGQRSTLLFVGVDRLA